MILTFPFKGHIIVTERTPASFGPGVFLLKQDAILSIHHSYIITLTNNNIVKIIENQNKKAFIVHDN